MTLRLCSFEIKTKIKEVKADRHPVYDVEMRDYLRQSVLGRFLGQVSTAVKAQERGQNRGNSSARGRLIVMPTRYNQV